MLLLEDARLKSTFIPSYKQTVTLEESLQYAYYEAVWYA